MNDKADQVCRLAIQNEGTINVQIVRIDDALARLARLESAPTANVTASNWNIGATTRRDNIVCKKDVANFGTQKGLAHQDWVSDVKTATEQVDELMVLVIKWIDRSHSSTTSNAKLVDGAKDIVRAKGSRGNIRGARAWKRVQVSAAGNSTAASGVGAQGPRFGALPAIRHHT